jgi:predicted secreted Zn-dependent protease
MPQAVFKFNSRAAKFPAVKEIRMFQIAKYLSLASCVCVSGLVPAVSQAKPLFAKTYTYFAVHGQTAEELDRELNSKGPKTGSSGTRHPGETQIKFGGSAQYFETAGSCRVKDAQISVATKIVLPTWKNANKASPSLALIWDVLSSDIKRHEERHAEIAHQHAKALEVAIKTLPPRKNCETMRAEVERVTEKAVATHDLDQQRFDKSEAINFQSRMNRLMTQRIKQIASKK